MSRAIGLVMVMASVGLIVGGIAGIISPGMRIASLRYPSPTIAAGTYDLTISIENPECGEVRAGEYIGPPLPLFDWETVTDGGTVTFPSWSSVAVEAIPYSGCSFDRWSGKYSTESTSINFTMAEDKSLTAHFSGEPTPTQYELTTSVKPGGAGTVEPSSGTYDKGTEVTLTATASSGYTFDHWSGDISGVQSTVTVTMNSNINVVANFVEEAIQPTYTLTTGVKEGNGTVTGEGEYDEGETATVEATPDSGYVFDRWSGDVGGSENPKSVVMNSDKSVYAHFVEPKPPEVTLTVRCEPTEGGTVGLAAAKELTFEEGESATITANPSEGYEFDYWSGAAFGKARTVTIGMDADKSVTAHFKKSFIKGILGNLHYLFLLSGIPMLIGGVFVLRG